MSSNITDEDRAYLAGLIDGEGCIFISKAKQSRRPHLIVYRLVVVIAQSNEPYLNYWKKKTGLGRVHCVNKKDFVYQWHCGSRDAEKLLRLVYPYLMIKREQADVAFEFRQTKGQEGGGGGRRRDSVGLQNHRAELRHKLMALKKGYMVAEVEQDITDHDPCPEQMRLL